MNMMRRYGFGLWLDSEVEIPGTIDVDPAALDTDTVHITWTQSPQTSVQAPLYALHNDCLEFSPPSVGQYRIRPDAIKVGVFAGADPDFARDLLIATALPALLWMRGKLMLHAAGITLPAHSGTVAIVGASGAGKSTLAHRLLDQGGILVGDDSLALEVGTGGTTATGLSGGLFLGRGRARAFMAVAPERSALEARLSAIIILDDQGNDGTLRRLHGVKALEKLLAHQHRPSVPALLRQSGRAIESLSNIVRSVPIIAWHGGRDGANFDVDALGDKIAGILSGDIT
jgi:hypothetical protein